MRGRKKSKSSALQASTIGIEGSMKSVSFLTLAVVFSRIALKVLKNTSFHFVGSRALFFYF
jgi:hypothetical protein